MIWIVGSEGMLGRELSALAEAAGAPFIGTDRDVDITDPSSVQRFVSGRDIAAVMNCAAYTAVDAAEDDVEAAERLNARAPGHLAHAAAAAGARLIQVSTDYVFAGDRDEPLAEDEPAHPIGVYGRTKREGEEAVLASGCAYDIIRTAWLYGVHGRNFVSMMIRLMNERSELRVVDDQIGSPTWARDLAGLLLHLAMNPQRPSGIYHYSNEGRTSWYGFAAAILEEARERRLVTGDVSIRPCSSDEYPTRAQRPTFSLLDKDRVRRTFDWAVPHWRDSLRSYLDILGEKHE